jgi:hypothetical protein
MNRSLLGGIAAVSMLWSGAAPAFTPESGFWIAPAEGGRGYSIEIQDNYIFLAFYVYDSQGRTVWYTAQGNMNGNARFVAQLDGYANGQCLTCVTPVNPQVGLGVGGNIEIVFDTEVRGRLVLNGRTINIERFNFALARGLSDIRAGSMLGEWQAILDYSAVPSVDSRYYGDVMVFNRLRSSGGVNYYEGCRPDNTVTGTCSSSALANRDASGFFDPASGRHFIVIGNTSTTLAVYSLTMGTYQFDGTMKVCSRNLSSITAQCLNNGAITSQPVRGFRTASRNFVQTGTGPASADPDPKSGAMVAGLPMAEDPAKAGQASEGFDPATLPAAALDALARSMQR